jgi:hypothetical protein
MRRQGPVNARHAGASDPSGRASAVSAGRSGGRDRALEPALWFAADSALERMDSNVQFRARATVSWVRPSWADLPAHRSSEQLPTSAYRSNCRATVRGTATHRPDQAASNHGRAVGGASASRNRRFESVPLQRRIRCEPDFRTGDNPALGPRNELTTSPFSSSEQIYISQPARELWLWKPKTPPE